MVFLRVVPAMLVLATWVGAAEPKIDSKKAAKKEAKEARRVAAPAGGVKTPGVLIPATLLKADATFDLASPPTGAHFGDAVSLADASGLRRFDAKTNKAFEPSRDVKELAKACGGIVNAFASLWTATCGAPALAKLELPPAGRGSGGRRGGPPPAKEAANDGATVAVKDGAKVAVKDGAQEVAKESNGGAASQGAAALPKDASAQPEPAQAPQSGQPKAALGPAANASGAPKAELPKPMPPAKPPVLTPLEASPTAGAALAASDDSLWLLADGKTSLQRIDPETSAILAGIRLPSACTAILFAESALWVVCPSEAKLLRIDPRTNLVEKRIEVPAEPIALAAGEGSIWVLSRKEGKVARIDPKTNKSTATIDLGIPNSEGALAFGEGSLWASAPGFPVMRIAPATDKVVQQFHGEGGGWVAFGAGSVWVGSAKGSSVQRYDPKRIQATLPE